MSQPTNKRELLELWLKRLQLLEACHYEAAIPFTRGHLGLGIPMTILTTVVGTTVFATMEKSVDKTTTIVVGSISVLAAILAGLQTFLQLGSRAAGHRSLAIKIGPTRRLIEQLLIGDPNQLPDDTVSSVRVQIDQLASESQTISSGVFEKIKTRLSTKES
jgi:hypothetical protein